jgi:hypothetical protein
VTTTVGVPVRHAFESPATEPPAAGPPAAAEPPLAWDPAAVRALREREYARLDSDDQAYLDYTGGGIYAESQLREHMALLRQDILGARSG